MQLTGRTDDGYGQTFRFLESAYGHYEAYVPLTNSGMSLFDIHEDGGESWTTAWVWNPPGKEFDITGPDMAALSLISAKTGGRVLPISKFTFPESKWSLEPVSLQYGLLILALFSFLIELFLRSTSMKQLKMAEAVLSVWWSVKLKIIEKAKAFKKKASYNEDRKKTALEEERNRQKTFEAYRYLAERTMKMNKKG